MFIFLMMCLAVFGLGLASLAYLDRLKERHHLYWALPFCFIPVWPIQLLAFVVLLDDCVQHLVQACDTWLGGTPRPDWSPCHRLYVWTVVHLTTLL